MEMTARRGLSHLIEKCVSIMERDCSQRPASVHLGLEDSRTYPQCGPGYLHVNVGRRKPIAEQNGQPDDALVADGSHLGRLAVRHRVDQRRDAALDEIHELDGLVRSIKGTAVLQRHGLEVRA